MSDSDLSTYTVSELRDQARELGIEDTSGLKKAELIELIEEALTDPGRADEDSGLVEIEKRMSGQWWCPICGNVNQTGENVCGECDAVREGTAVRPA